MHTNEAFKRRGNMSCDDSRAGNATSARAPVLNRGSDDMRIVCLITVGAFLLSIAIAESDVPIGASQYQRTRPIILEPMLKMSSSAEDNPLNWFVKMVHRAIEPKKPPMPMIGPINLPGMGGHIYIRQVEKTLMPWEKNRVVIKLVSRDPVNGNALPTDTQSYHHRPEDPSRRTAKNFGYQPANNARPIGNKPQSGFFPVSPQPQYNTQYPSQYSSQYSPQYPSQYPSQFPSQQQSWHPQQRPHYQNHRNNNFPQYSKPFVGSTPNDFRHENYGKQADQGYPTRSPEEFPRRRPSRMNSPSSQRFTPGVAQPMNAVPLPSMYRSVARPNPDPVYPSGRDYRDQFSDPQDIESQGDGYFSGSPPKPDSPKPTQLPYPEYSGLADAELEPVASTKTDNVTEIEATSTSPFDNYVRYSIAKPVVRNDRMIASNRENLRGFVRGRSQNNHHHHHRGTKSRGYREGAKYPKFEARDVGGIEVIAAPNLQRGWEELEGRKSKEDEDYSAESRETSSELNDDEDSASMENGKKLARGESVEYSSEQPEIRSEESFVAAPSNSRRSSYKVIDRSHRSRGSRRGANSTLTDNSRETSSQEEIEGRIDVSEARPTSVEKVHVVYPEVDESAKRSNVTAAVVRKVVSLTRKSRRPIQSRRKPRVVKAIYRRKAVPGIIKSSAESTESGESGEEKNSKETSAEN